MHRFFLLLLQLLIADLLTTTSAQTDVAPTVFPGDPPSGCLNSMVGMFDVNSGSGDSTWTDYANVTLIGGIMKSLDMTVFVRTTDSGVIAADPPGDDAQYTGGWAICPNGSVTLGPQVNFWICPIPDWIICQRKVNDSCNPALLQVNTIGELYSASLTITSNSQTQTSTQTQTQTLSPASITSAPSSQAVTVFVTSTPTSSPVNSSPSSSGLSAGAEAGIGAGAGIAGALAVGIGLFLFRRRKSGIDKNNDKERAAFIQHAPAETGIVHTQQRFDKAELPWTSVHGQGRERWELEQHDRVGRNTAELEGYQHR